MIYKELVETLKNLGINNFNYLKIILSVPEQTVKVYVDYWSDSQKTVLIQTEMFLNGWYNILYDILTKKYNLTTNINYIVIENTDYGLKLVYKDEEV